MRDKIRNIIGIIIAVGIGMSYPFVMRFYPQEGAILTLVLLIIGWVIYRELMKKGIK